MVCKSTNPEEFMSRKKNAKSQIILKRMKDTQISERMLAQHLMLPIKEVSAWLRGEKEMPWAYVWKTCEMLGIDSLEAV
jgi:hypothetical protein